MLGSEAGGAGGQTSEYPRYPPVACSTAASPRAASSRQTPRSSRASRAEVRPTTSARMDGVSHGRPGATGQLSDIVKCSAATAAAMGAVFSAASTRGRQRRAAATDAGAGAGEHGQEGERCEQDHLLHRPALQHPARPEDGEREEFSGAQVGKDEERRALQQREWPRRVSAPSDKQRVERRLEQHGAREQQRA